MRRPFIIIVSVIVVFLILGTIVTSMMGAGTPFSAANRAVAPSYGMGGGGAAPEVAAGAPVPAEPPMPSTVTNDAAKSTDFYNSSNAQAPQDRLVIQNVDLSIVIKDPKTRMAEIAKLANDMNGYVVSSNLYQSTTSLGKEVPEATIVIRVPAERLDEALTKVKEGAVEVPTENRSGQDVTNVYVDLQSQLTAKEAAEKKLLEIMDTATKAEDVLAIYMQVQTVQTEIEQLKGQIKYYEESARLSSISVRLIAEESTQPITVGPWKPEGAAKAAVEDLIRFLQNFADFLIRFVIFTLPALILIAIPLFILYLIGRAVYRRTRKPKAVIEETDVVKK